MLACVVGGSNAIGAFYNFIEDKNVADRLRGSRTGRQHCGDPSLEVTEKLVYVMKEAGADLIELDIPFSDPTAEGPVIQEANIRALSGGVTTDIIFDMVAKIRKNTQIPMVFMTYANVVYSYGTERYAQCVSGNTIFSSENSYL